MFCNVRTVRRASSKASGSCQLTRNFFSTLSERKKEQRAVDWLEEHLWGGIGAAIYNICRAWGFTP